MKVIRWMIKLGVAGLAAGLAVILVTYLVIAPDLPDV